MSPMFDNLTKTAQNPQFIEQDFAVSFCSGGGAWPSTPSGVLLFILLQAGLQGGRELVFFCEKRVVGFFWGDPFLRQRHRRGYDEQPPNGCLRHHPPKANLKAYNTRRHLLTRFSTCYANRAIAHPAQKHAMKTTVIISSIYLLGLIHAGSSAAGEKN